MDLASLRQLSRTGVAGPEAPVLRDVAHWCEDWCRATGDGRFCLLGRLLAGIDTWQDEYEEAGGVPDELLTAVNDLLRKDLPRVLDEQSPASATEMAALLEQDVRALLHPADRWTEGATYPTTGDPQNVGADEAVANILVRLKAVAFRTDPFFTFTSGTTSPIYVDNRRLLGHPPERRTIVTRLSGLLAGQSLDVFAGTATAGIPWAAWLADAHDVPMLYVRGTKKPWGHQRAIEGEAPEGSSVVVVEDLTFTAGSLATSVQHLRSEGYQVAGSVAIVSYETRAGNDRIGELGIAHRTLTTIDATVDAAEDLDLLTAEQRGVVLEWISQTRK
jgi:orotate phosphoribosyltransferase